MQLASFDKKIIVLPNGLPFIYLPDLHLTCELSKFEVKISFEILQLWPTPISLKFAATGWSINNRTILNCSHFLPKRYFFNPFSPKRSIHAGKLPQQHEFANASFVILVRCHFVSPYHVDGSANNNVLCRGGHFCEIARVLAH